MRRCFLGALLQKSVTMNLFCRLTAGRTKCCLIFKLSCIFCYFGIQFRPFFFSLLKTIFSTVTVLIQKTICKSTYFKSATMNLFGPFNPWELKRSVFFKLNLETSETLTFVLIFFLFCVPDIVIITVFRIHKAIYFQISN